ncbi:hypothetical protein [Amycolatopsis sp. cmx-4-83]|uniref:hypothetical protein n=1 Tax=Amycolatopsis sp. cmx-4-83 TaxID=2790940 RepID=UPI00397DA680
MSLVDILFFGPALRGGNLRVELEDGTSEVKLVADTLVRKLHNQPELQASAHGKLPLVAGSLRAAQVNDSAVEHRLSIPVEVSPAEALIWVIALCTFANSFGPCPPHSRAVHLAHSDAAGQRKPAASLIVVVSHSAPDLHRRQIPGASLAHFGGAGGS